MLRSRADVDNHVQQILRKVKNDQERNLRSFSIAQLYFKVQDYDKARRYASMYLSARDDSSSAHKLLGQALEELGNKEKAIMAYKKSLELEPNQADLVLKICELLCDKEVTFDPSNARYWADRATALFPHSSVLFTLKEKLLGTEADMNSQDFEKLFQVELKSRPNDVKVRIKLLNLYLKTGRTELAMNHAFDIETKQIHPNQLSWYQCVNNICESYEKEFPTKCNWEFYMHWLLVLDRLCSLTVSEVLSQPTNLVEATEAVYKFDQVLWKGDRILEKTPDIYNVLYEHLSSQLPYRIGCLLLRRAKKESTLWKEIKRMVAPLMLIATREPPNTEAAWCLSIKDSHRKLLSMWVHHAQCRIVECGCVLLALTKECQSEKNFIEKTNHFAVNDWRKSIFQKAFRTLEGSDETSSFFANSSMYGDIPRQVLAKSSLKPNLFVPSYESTYVASLHHLVWLGLQSLVNGGSALSCKLSPIISTTYFTSFQLTVNNLNNTGVETINQLDMDSFLYATVFNGGILLEDQKTNGCSLPEKLQTLPPDLTPMLCTPEQSKWWANACSIAKNSTAAKSKPSEIRQNLQRGIEVIRGEGMPLILLVSLARTFATKALEEEGSVSKACEERALHLWRIAIPQLERLEDKQIWNTHKNLLKFFDYPVKDLSSNEASNLLEEGQFFIGCYYMKTGQNEKAIEAFKSLRNPQATFNQALIYLKMAEDEFRSLRGEEITSENRSRHAVLATKSRDCFYQVRNMIKGDSSHPLQHKLKEKLMEIDDLLSRIEPENDYNARDGYMSETSLSLGSGASPIGDNNHTPNMHSYSRHKNFPSSTPLRYYDYRHRSGTADIVELLNVHQNTNQLKNQQVLEHLRLVLDRLESISSDQRTQRNSVEDLINKFNKLETEVKSSISELKKEVKRPDLYNMLDEDDYNEDMLQHYQNIPFYPQRGVQGAAAATVPVSYPAALPQFFSPRVDQMYQGLYNQAPPFPFPDGSQVSDFLRSVPQTATPLNTNLGAHKIGGTTPGSLQGGMGSQGITTATPLGLGQQPLGVGLGQGGGVAAKPLSQFASLSPPTPLRPPLVVAPTNVVITSSDALPTSAPPVQPTLSVTIPPQHRLGTPAQPSLASTTSVPHNFQIPMPSGVKIVDKSPVQLDLTVYSDDEAKEPTIEHDPLPNFKPVVPLPDEVDVKTGEENETILFERRAKLYRFVDKQWKERGVGMLKILKDESTGKCRVLMRRDQVHKICANHFIMPDSKLERMQGSDQAWIWVANDFADEEIRLEKLCAKFKTPEDGLLFKKTFDEVKALVPAATPPKNTSASSSLNFSSPQNLSFQSFTSPANSSMFGILKPPVLNVSDKSQGEQDCSPRKDSEKVSVGGFTFMSTPKLKPEEKKEEKVMEEKKPESPFATFSFTPNSGTVGSLFKDNKASTPKSILSEVQNKTPSSQKHVMFSSTVSDLTQSKEPKEVVTPIKSFQSTSGFGIQSTLNLSQVSTVSSPGASEDDFVPTTYFKPVIPLPELVEVKSGEENEVVLFEERGKLLRFCTDTKQWKERGIGQMKILRDPATRIVRLLMRREQVLKVCCNHRITKDINMKRSSTSGQAVTWAAMDYAEEEGKKEIFTLKFSSPEKALAFKEAFQRAQADIPVSPKQNGSSKTEEKNLSEKTIEPAPIASMVATTVSSKGEGKTDPSSNSLSKFLPKTGSWECQGCFIINNENIIRCPACNSLKPGTKEDQEKISSVGTATGFGFGSTEFNFGAANKDQPKYNFNSAATFTFGAQKSNENTAVSSTTSIPPLSSFMFENSGVESSPLTSLTPAVSSGFTFGVQPNLKTLSDNSFVTNTSSPIASSFTFGSTPVSQPENKFSFGSKEFHFTMPNISASVKSPVKSPLKTDESEGENEDEDESCDNIVFTPVIPLPEKINVVTGEEDEIVLYSHRAKLFRYDSQSKEWKERGVGDIKILQHKESGKIRLLMRREPIMKICLNHYLSEGLEIKPKDSKSWIWHAADFADGEVSQEKFALRFKSSDIAADFKEAITDAKERIGVQPSPEKIEESTKSVSNTSTDSKTELSFSSPLGKTTSFSLNDSLLGKTGFQTEEKSQTSSDDDIEVVFEKSVSEEDRQKALSLQLPPNFYSYKNAPPCPGCIGCDKSDEDLDEKKESEKPVAKEFSFKSSFSAPTITKGGIAPSTFSSKATEFSFAIPGDLTPSDKKPEVVNAPTPGGLFGQAFKDFSTSNSSFFSQNLGSFSQLATPTSSIFGGQRDASITQQPSFLNDSSEVSFSSVKGDGKAFTKVSENFKWEGAGQKVFGQGGKDKEVDKSKDDSERQESDGEEGESDDDNSKEPEVQFQPVIPLPQEIELRTGEEDEQILFSERAKLFRYDTKTREWKERGVGNMKILRHKEKCIYRLLMRREQVHKIVCNLLITQDLDLKPLSSSAQAWCWISMNLAQDYETPQLEQLAVRFKDKTLALAFKSVVDSAKEFIASSKK